MYDNSMFCKQTENTFFLQFRLFGISSNKAFSLFFVIVKCRFIIDGKYIPSNLICFFTFSNNAKENGENDKKQQLFLSICHQVFFCKIVTL